MLARYFLLIVGMGLSMGTGCDSRKGAEYRKLESFMEQRIDLSRLYAPEDLAKSTVRMPGPKIVHYLDSSGCVGCKLQSLRMWNVVRGRMRVPVVLVVHVPDMQAIHALYAACALRYVGIFRRDLSYRPGGLPYVFIKRS